MVLAHWRPEHRRVAYRPLLLVAGGSGSPKKRRAITAPYDLWAEQGYLETTPGPRSSYEYVAARLKDIFDEYQVTKVAFDRWNYTHLKPWLSRAGFSEALLEETFVPFGQGTQSMSPALRELESIILDRKLRHGGHPVLNMCCGQLLWTEGPRRLKSQAEQEKVDGQD